MNEILEVHTACIAYLIWQGFFRGKKLEGEKLETTEGKKTRNGFFQYILPELEEEGEEEEEKVFSLFAVRIFPVNYV